MYSEAISNSIWDLLSRLNSIAPMASCYLGGGTGLALQLGHRISKDLDFFVTKGSDLLSFEMAIKSKGLETLVLNQTSDHTEMMIQSVRVDLIRERIPLKFPLQPIDGRISNLKMADPKDIGRMKILSIGSRGSKKDFVDLYCLTRKVIPLGSLLTLAMEEDHGIRYSKLLFLKGLVDFEQADREADLTLLWDIGWEEVKRSITEEVRHIAGRIGQ
jgi:hypothetical protein